MNTTNGFVVSSHVCTAIPGPTLPINTRLGQGRNNGPTYTVNGETITRPSFGNNMRYFFNYQLGHMYWRYFMWNFSGRQNDIQGYGDIMHGNWITGIKFLDELRLGNQDELPDNLKNEKANNKYYMLPFLLGLLGIFTNTGRGKPENRIFG